MNSQAIQAVLTHSRSTNGARLVLLVLAAHADERGRVINFPISKIMAESNAKERTVKYAIEELRDELKELTTERAGKGRGSTFDFDLSPLLKRVQISTSDKGADIAPIKAQQSEGKGANSAKIKGADIDSIDADSAPLSDGRVQISTGTPLAPTKAETINTDKELKKGSAAAHARQPPDPRTRHPAILAVKSFMQRNPEKVLYDDLIETLGEEPDMQKLSACRKAWVKAGYNVNSLAWVLEWYANGIPERTNGNAKSSGNSQPNESANLRQHRENYEHFVRRRAS
jgi:hypothetical protein